MAVKETQQLNGRLQQFNFSKELLNDEEVASLYNAGRLSSTTSVSINYDELGRLKYKSVNPEGTSFKTSYQYETGEKSNSTTTKVSELDNNGQKIEYSYDDNGNIEVIAYKKEALFEATKIYYTYNELNELIREDNEVLNKTIKYSYDAGGNIMKKEEFAYTREVPGTPTKTYEYKYEDTNWKDKLTSFYDGEQTKQITYDAIGNPLTYDGWTFTWEEGRQLASMSKAGTIIAYKYNDSGIRTEKTVNGVTTKYHLSGSDVTYEDNGTDKIYYTYDSSGHLISMNLNGTEYYYIRNVQGDIIGLFDSTGTQVVSYTYDTWGKLISIDGSLKDTVGVKNPYRYRGYRYDTETALYYLQSRYYNPTWGRFINADGIIGQTGELLGHNVFLYCKNNVVNMYDPSGFRHVYMFEDEYTSRDIGKVETYYPSVSNTVGTVFGTSTGLLENINKSVVGYTDKNFIVHFYAKTSIAQKIIPYASMAKKLSKAFTVVTTTVDVVSTWDPMAKMSLGQRTGKTVTQLAGLGVAIAVGTFISGPLLASGMALGGGAAIAGTVGSFTIDLAAGATISYGQSIVYRKCGME